MRFILPFLLGLGWFAGAAVIPSHDTHTAELGARDAAGYRSVAYFVNWVCTIKLQLSTPSTQVG
jgi:chitinase